MRATKNSVFHKVCSVYYVMGEQRLPIYFGDPERGRRSHAEHLQIFDALLRRDGNLAQALMSAHLQGAESYWKGLIGGWTRSRAARRRSKRPETRAGHLFDPCAASARGGHARGRRRAEVASALDADTLAAEGRGAEIVIVRAPLPRAFSTGARRLRAAIRHGAGLDMIPVEAATKAGVLVANVPARERRARSPSMCSSSSWRC